MDAKEVAEVDDVDDEVDFDKFWNEGEEG